MKMKLRIVSLLICALMLCGLFAGCGGGSSYRDDVPVDQLAAAVEAASNVADSMIDAPATYVAVTMKMDVSAYDGYCVRINSRGVNIDEYGIFKAKDSSQAKEIKAAVDAYLQYRIDIWMVEYMPEEYPKLENAQVSVLGNYVMYTIFSDTAREAARTALESALEQQ